MLAQETYRSYANARFSYSIEYPPDLLVPQGESDNGDGQKFLSHDGHAELLVYGSNNALHRSLKSIYESEISTADHPGRVVTYKVLRADWFVISGREAGKIFYLKTYLKDGVFKTMRFEYDEAAKQTYDPVTVKIARSFRG